MLVRSIRNVRAEYNVELGRKIPGTVIASPAFRQVRNVFHFSDVMTFKVSHQEGCACPSELIHQMQESDESSLEAGSRVALVVDVFYRW